LNLPRDLPLLKRNNNGKELGGKPPLSIYQSD
jgi:hypothetical protein